MRCHQCGTDNPEKNNFCGNCGSRLLHAPVREIAEPVTIRSSRQADDDEAPGWADPIKPAAYLDEELRPEPPRTVAADEVRPKPTVISGPSFLGLTDSTETDQSSYLLEDDQPRLRGGWLAFLLIVIALFAGIGYLEWDTVKSGQLTIPFIHNADSQPQPRTTPAPIVNAYNQQTATPAPGTPQSDNAASDQKSAPESASTTASPTANSHTNSTEVNATSSAESSDSSATGENSESPKPKSAGSASISSRSDSTSSVSNPEPAKTNALPPTPKVKAKPSASVAAPPAPDPQQNRMLFMGEKYLYGRGVPQNCNQALVYFKAAAEQDNGPAMAHLGAMYASGNCVTQNRATAYRWFARAQNAEPEDPWLQKNMNILWRDMTAQERAAVTR